MRAAAAAAGLTLSEWLRRIARSAVANGCPDTAADSRSCVGTGDGVCIYVRAQAPAAKVHGQDGKWHPASNGKADRGGVR
jgi:hypothetical protein